MLEFEARGIDMDDFDPANPVDDMAEALLAALSPMYLASKTKEKMSRVLRHMMDDDSRLQYRSLRKHYRRDRAKQRGMLNDYKTVN